MNRYQNIQSKIQNGKVVYESVLLPEVKASTTDLVIMTVEGDRLDTLANQFYENSKLWWVIAHKNNLLNGDLALEGGITLRIPTVQEVNEIINKIK